MAARPASPWESRLGSSRVGAWELTTGGALRPSLPEVDHVERHRARHHLRNPVRQPRADLPPRVSALNWSGVVAPDAFGVATSRRNGGRCGGRRNRPLVDSQLHRHRPRHAGSLRSTAPAGGEGTVHPRQKPDVLRRQPRARRRRPLLRIDCPPRVPGRVHRGRPPVRGVLRGADARSPLRRPSTTTYRERGCRGWRPEALTPGSRHMRLGRERRALSLEALGVGS